MSPTEAAIAQRLVAELVDQAPMELVLRAHVVLQMTALMQLALRHPGVEGEPRATAERWLEAAREYFEACPTVLEVIRRGDDPAEDTPA